MSVYPALSALLQMKCIARPGEHTRLRELVGWESSAAGPAIDRTERFLNAKSTSSKLRGRGRHHKRHKKIKKVNKLSDLVDFLSKLVASCDTHTHTSWCSRGLEGWELERESGGVHDRVGHVRRREQPGVQGESVSATGHGDIQLGRTFLTGDTIDTINCPNTLHATGVESVSLKPTPCVYPMCRNTGWSTWILSKKIEVFYMLFERYLPIFSMTSLKQHIKYFHFLWKIQLDPPVIVWTRPKPYAFWSSGEEWERSAWQVGNWMGNAKTPVVYRHEI